MLKRLSKKDNIWRKNGPTLIKMWSFDGAFLVIKMKSYNDVGF